MLIFFISRFRYKKAVVQQYFPNPLLVFGMPINIRAYVLVTSINPLRAYIHSEGLVHFRHDYQRGFKKVNSTAVYKLCSQHDIDLPKLSMLNFCECFAVTSCFEMFLIA